MWIFLRGRISMRKIAVISCLLSPVLVVLGSSIAHAQPNPQEIYRNCVQSVVAAAQHCIATNMNDATRCAKQIRRLLRQGKVEEARALAERCRTKIEEQSKECIERIETHCARCIQALERLGAHRLADMLRRICQRAVSSVEMSRERALAILRQLFENRPAPR
jgi:hypothetical protein